MIRDIILDPCHGEMAHLTEAFLYASSVSPARDPENTSRAGSGKYGDMRPLYGFQHRISGLRLQLGERVRIINEIAVDGLVPGSDLSHIGRSGMKEKSISNGVWTG